MAQHPRPEDDAPRDAGPGRPGRLVTIARFPTVQQAEVLAAMLESHGVTAFIPNHHSSALLPHLFGAVNPQGIQVLIHEEAVDAAREALRPWVREADEEAIGWVSEAMLPDSEAQMPPDPAGRMEDEEDEAQRLAIRALRGGLYSFLFPPLAPYALLVALAALTHRDAPRTGPARRRWHRRVTWGILFSGMITLLLVALVASLLIRLAD